MKTIIVTGARGHLGNTIIRELKDYKNIKIIGLIHTKAPNIMGDNINYIKCDVTDINSLRKSFSDASGEIIVIHTAALISIEDEVSKKVYDVNVNGTKNMLKVSSEYNVKRFIHVSSVHAIPEGNFGEKITEVDYYDKNLVVGGYAKTKAEAAQYVLNYNDDTLERVILLPSGIIGPYNDGSNYLVDLTKRILNGSLPAYLNGGYDLVDVRDVASAAISAIKNGRNKESYILSGEYIKISKLIEIINEYRPIKKIIKVSRWVAKILVYLFKIISIFKAERPLFTNYALHALYSNSNFSNLKARRELNFKPRSARESILDMVKWIEK